MEAALLDPGALETVGEETGVKAYGTESKRRVYRTPSGLLLRLDFSKYKPYTTCLVYNLLLLCSGASPLKLVIS